MPPKAGSIKAEDGRFYTPKEMSDLGLKPAKKAAASKKRSTRADASTKKTTRGRRKKATKDEEVKSVQVVSGEEERKMSTKRGEVVSDKSKLPRVTLTCYDDKGRMVSTTFICNPETLRFSRNEDYEFTKTGKRKAKLFISIDADVVEIE
jgi:hypothetical protein